MSYGKRKSRLSGGARPAETWKASTHGMGKHSFVEDTPVGLGLRKRAAPAPAIELAEPGPVKPAHRSPTTTKPVRGEGRRAAVDPHTLIGGMIGRLILDDDGEDILAPAQAKAEELAARRGFTFVRRTDKRGAVYVPFRHMHNRGPAVYQPGFMAGELDTLRTSGAINTQRADSRIDVDVNRSAGRISLELGSPYGSEKGVVTANLTDVLEETLAPEQDKVRSRLGLWEREFTARMPFGRFEGNAPVPYELVEELESGLSIARISVGHLTVFP